MIEITFNRSVRICKNKVYRIGMVLNKVRTLVNMCCLFLICARWAGIPWEFAQEELIVKGPPLPSVWVNPMILLEMDSSGLLNSCMYSSEIYSSGPLFSPE